MNYIVGYRFLEYIIVVVRSSRISNRGIEKTDLVDKVDSSGIYFLRIL